MEYIVIIAVGALFATILLNAIQSESIQAAIVEKVRCAILFSGEVAKTHNPLQETRSRQRTIIPPLSTRIQILPQFLLYHLRHKQTAMSKS